MAAAVETPVPPALVDLGSLAEPRETAEQATMVVPAAMAARPTVLERLVAMVATAAIAPMAATASMAEPPGSQD
jgi:hypothetical protein